MMRKRLRERHPDEAAFYAQRYPAGYRHTAWPDHVERVAESVRFAVQALVPGYPSLRTIADLSCGDGSLATLLAQELGADRVILGDVNPGDAAGDLDVTGTLPDVLDELEHQVGLYVCSETLEHLDDPDDFLVQLRGKTAHLLLTTPEGETTNGNPEHYWGWDSEAVGRMLDVAGFHDVMAHQVFTPHSADVYEFQMWVVR